MPEFDLGIIGGGPGGYTAALFAAKQGKKVVLFEKDSIGGVCLNKGCIPTKSILHTSEIYNKIKNCSEHGISTGDVVLDYSKVIERKNLIVQKLKKGIELALKNAKVQIVNSEAKILSKTEISRLSISSCWAKFPILIAVSTGKRCNNSSAAKNESSELTLGIEPS